MIFNGPIVICAWSEISPKICIQSRLTNLEQSLGYVLKAYQFCAKKSNRSIAINLNAILRYEKMYVSIHSNDKKGNKYIIFCDLFRLIDISLN